MEDIFKRFRFDPSTHLGLGDIRLTIGAQEELMAEINTPRRAAEVSACAGFPTEELEKMAADALAILHNPMMIVGRDDDSAKREGFEMAKEAAAVVGDTQYKRVCATCDMANESCEEDCYKIAEKIRAIPYPGDAEKEPA